MNPQDRMPPPPDAAEWDQAAGEFYRGSLDRIRSSAEKWTGSVATLLGLFGTVALVAGPSEIAKVPSHVRDRVVGLIVLAGVAAGIAVLTGAFAAQGTPRRMSPWNGDAYRAYVTQQAGTARRLLIASRCTGIGAALLVFITGVTVLVAGSGAAGKEASGSQIVVVTRQGQLICGELVESRGSVTVGGQAVDDVSTVVPVSRC